MYMLLYLKSITNKDNKKKYKGKKIHMVFT